MDDYIKRNDAIREAIKAVDEWDGGYVTSRADMIAAYLNDVPAADVRENVRGEWKQGSLILNRSICSVCGWWTDEVSTDTYKFCPNCGAKMDGERRTE